MSRLHDSRRWRWSTARLGDCCTRCREPIMGHPITVSGTTIHCVRCSMVTGTSMGATAERRRRRRQLELA